VGSGLPFGLLLRLQLQGRFGLVCGAGVPGQAHHHPQRLLIHLGGGPPVPFGEPAVPPGDLLKQGLRMVTRDLAAFEDG
jgi:hypothetical protein